MVFPQRIDLIKKICKKYKIILIEDAAESLGSFINLNIQVHLEKLVY